MSFSNLLPISYKDDVKRWLQEDTPNFDIGGFVVGDDVREAILYAKSNGVLSGVPFFNAVFELLDCTVEWKINEGDSIDVTTSDGSKIVAAIVRGKCRNILLGERTALNIITRSSGVSTAARQASAISKNQGWHGMVAGTRKTTPGFRMVEKYALLVGGCATHRYDLSQMVMLKDNHIWSTGSITKAVEAAKQAGGFSIKVEVECQSFEEASEAATAGAEVVMLDNFTPTKLKECAEALKAIFPHVVIEASGGITEQTMGEYMSPFVDVISRGSLTQGYNTLDFSLKINKAL